jgi:uncharacterized protein
LKPSRYNITLPDEPTPGEMIIFNTLSGSLFVLEPDYRKSLEALQSGAELGPDDLERLGEMKNEGYVVYSGDEEEQKTVYHFRRTVYSPDSEFTAKILTTMACNLACEYCFESRMDRAHTMNLETAEAAVEMIKERVDEISAQKINLDFYGGEPLLNQEVIKYVSNELGAWCKETGRSYGFTMTTNGTLLTIDTVNQLLPLGFKAARVSMDGVKEVHDARRPFRKGQGSPYDLIIKNLKDIVELLPVTITMVYPEKDPGQLDIFLDDLESKGLLDKLASIQPGLVSGYMDQEGSICNPNDCDMNADQARLFVSLVKTLAQRGVRIRQDLLASSNCSLSTSSGTWIINPQGLIHKCPMLCGNKEYAVGSVLDDGFGENYFKDLNRELWQRCLKDSDCPYLPMCGSGLGCRLAAKAQEGDLWGMACSRDFFEFYVPEAMRMEVESTDY